MQNNRYPPSTTTIQVSDDIEFPLRPRGDLQREEAKSGKRWLWPERQQPWARTTLAFLVLKLIVAVAVEGYIMKEANRQINQYFDSVHDADDPFNVRTEKQYKSVNLYSATLLIAQFFLVLVGWDAVVQKNTLEMGCLIIYSLGMTAYSIIQYDQNDEADLDNDTFVHTDTMKLAERILTGIESISVIFLLFLFWKLKEEFGWAIYRRIGADIQMRGFYRNYHILLLLMKFTCFFVTLFLTILLVLVKNTDDRTLLVNGVIGMPLLFATMIVGWHGVKRESKTEMSAFIGGCTVAVLYVTYRILRMYQLEDKGPNKGIRRTRTDYEFTTRYLTFFGSISLSLLLGCIAYGMICTMRFGRGLKPYVNKMWWKAGTQSGERKAIE